MDYIYCGKPIEQLDFEQFVLFLQSIGTDKKASFDKKIIKSSMINCGTTSLQNKEIFQYLRKNDHSKIMTFPNGICFETSVLKARLILFDKTKTIETRLAFLKEWIKSADSWAHTDSLFAGYKPKVGEFDALLSFSEDMVSHNSEFEIRLGVIVLLDYFLNDKNISDVFRLLSKVTYGKYYYVDMAVAWLCATSLINFEDQTFSFLNSGLINDFTYKKSLQKACESFRISPDKKIRYKALFRAK